MPWASDINITIFDSRKTIIQTAFLLRNTFKCSVVSRYENYSKTHGAMVEPWKIPQLVLNLLINNHHVLCLSANVQ
jgi:hypothetical protein